MQRELRVGVFLIRDNEPVYTALVAVGEAVKCAFELLPHPPYSPDLALSDFLFPKRKFPLCGCHFGNNDEVIRAMEELLEQ